MAINAGPGYLSVGVNCCFSGPEAQKVGGFGKALSGETPRLRIVK